MASQPFLSAVEGSGKFAAPQPDDKSAERSVPPTVRRLPLNVCPASQAKVARLRAAVDARGDDGDSEVRSLGGTEAGSQRGLPGSSYRRLFPVRRKNKEPTEKKRTKLFVRLKKIALFFFSLLFSSIFYRFQISSYISLKYICI